MEFREFPNPEGKDYDINSSPNSFNPNVSSNSYSEQLIDLIGGIIEDATEEKLQEQYGISMEEYFNPTKETIDKVKRTIFKRHR